MDISTTRTTTPVDDARLAEILANPGFGIHFTDHMFTVEWTPADGWNDARVTPYGPLTLDPATAVLHYAQEIFEGMKAYRHEDGSVWTFRPEANAERMVRSSRRLALPELPVARLRPGGRRAGRGRPALGARQRGGEEPLHPAVHVRVRDVPRRAAGQHVTFMVIASPAGAYFSKGVKPVTLWLSTEYTRAGRGGMGAAKTGGNYASSLSPSRRPPPTAATRWSSSTPRRASTSRSSAA